MQVTYFKSFAEVGSPIHTEVSVVLKAIQECKIQDKIDVIRSIEDSKERRKLKEKLPCVLFAGKFSERKDKALISHSGLCVLDWDHLSDVPAKKEELKKHSFLYSIFVSPSGDGLKAIARIPAEKEKHRGYYRGLIQVFPELDSTSQNESRICFLSSDPDIYINPDAVEFTEWIPEKVVKQTVKKAETDYKLIDRAVKMIRESVNGNKHETLLKASKLMGGYIANGIVDEFEAKRILEHEISHKDIDDLKAARQTIESGIEYGKAEPIELKEKTTSGILPKHSGIKIADEVWERMKHGFKHGKERGKTTYFKDFDLNFTWKRNELTLIIGFPNSGKTEFMLQLMLIKSVKDKYKWGIYSPENYPEEEFYDSLIHTYIGKTTDPYFGKLQMTFDEYEAGYSFIKEHFFYVYPDEAHTIGEIESRFLSLIENKKIDGVFIDPFNQLDIDLGIRDDKFLSGFLTDRKRFAIDHNLHYVISAHPKTMHKKKDGKYDVPDIYDINNGAMWGNKMDNIMVVFRPNYHENPADTVVEIHVKKIKKQKLVGIPGTCEFNYTRKQNRYYINGYSPFELNNIFIPEPKNKIINTYESIREQSEPEPANKFNDINW